jgi:hypothetical protein
MQSDKTTLTKERKIRRDKHHNKIPAYLESLLSKVGFLYLVFQKPL